MKRRHDRFTISIYLLPLFLAVFLTACEVRDSYMNAEVISADETSITVRPIKAGDSHAPKGVLEAETLKIWLPAMGSVSSLIRIPLKREKYRKSGSCSRSTVWMRMGRW